MTFVARFYDGIYKQEDSVECFLEYISMLQCVFLENPTCNLYLHFYNRDVMHTFPSLSFSNTYLPALIYLL